MATTFKRISLFIIIIGVFAFAIRLTFGTGTTTLIQHATTNGIDYFKIDIWAYINNIKTGLGQVNELTLRTQTLEWKVINSNILQGQFWADLGNNMAYILNWVIFGLNILIYPFRIGAYLIKFILMVFGLNMTSATNNGLWWLKQLIDFLLTLQIPYVGN